MERPDWFYIDMRQVGIDFADPAQVASYDERQGDDSGADRELLEQMGVGPGQIIADIGCGTGLLACEAAKLGATVHAVDISAEMLATTMARAKAQGVDRVMPHHAGFLSHAIAPESLDLAISKFALHHLPDLWKGVALTRLNRALKPGGRMFLRDVVFVCDPAEVPIVAEEWIAWMGHNTGYDRAEVATHIRDEHSTYSWIMAGLIERAGFRIQHAEYSQRIYADYWAEKI
jgi:ubiquinone/menaquinone biosynthesis C-methylase UbiE